MKKILFLANHLNPGGITTYLRILSRFLDCSKFQIHIASSGGSLLGEFEKLGVKHHFIPLSSSAEMNPRMWISLFKLKKIVQLERFDIVHTQSRTTQVLGKLLQIFYPSKRVFTCHGFFKKRFFRMIFPCWEDEVIAISRPVQENLLNVWRLDPKRVHLIPHGVEAESFSKEEKMNIKARHHLPENKIIVGALGRLSPVKGYDVLIHAFHLLCQENKEVHLMIVGDGNEKEKLYQLSRQLGIDGKISFVSPQAGERIQIYYEFFDIFCAPSREEGLGLSIMEAMSYGKAVVASRVGGIPDLIESDHTGLLVSPEHPLELKSAISHLILYPEICNNLKRQAREFAKKNFSIRDMIQKTEMVYGY